MCNNIVKQNLTLHSYYNNDLSTIVGFETSGPISHTTTTVAIVPVIIGVVVAIFIILPIIVTVAIVIGVVICVSCGLCGFAASQQRSNRRGSVAVAAQTAPPVVQTVPQTYPLQPQAGPPSAMLLQSQGKVGLDTESSAVHYTSDTANVKLSQEAPPPYSDVQSS